MAETFINSNQIRDIGDDSSETLLNHNQVRIVGDISTKTLINTNQISSLQPDWQLGDRLDNKATFVGYFDSIDPATQATQRYAYFVLDAQYRSSSKLKDNTSGVLSADSPIPVNATYEDALARTESATYNCAKLEAVGTFPAIDFAKTVSVSYNSNIYYGVIPNAAEILEIYNNRETLDTYDPTVADYTTQSLTSWGGLEFWTSSAANSSTENGLTFWKKRDKNLTPWVVPGQINNSNFAAKACPIIEIPV